MPVRSDSSAMRAVRFDERTAENVATASTRVPPAVANDAIVVQSAMGLHPIERTHGAKGLAACARRTVPTEWNTLCSAPPWGSDRESKLGSGVHHGLGTD